MKKLASPLLSSVLALLFLLCPLLGLAQDGKTHSFVQRSTDVLCLLPSATGAVVAWVNHDKKGALQLTLSTATCLALNYSLELCIRKDRPDGTGHHAFPSTHTAIAFDGASFLMRRYGWKWGVPAYLVSSYVAWGRVHAKRHDWWDVLAGATIGAGAAYIFTRPFTKHTTISLSPTTFGNDAYGLTADIRF